MKALLEGLKAAAEPTRLRLLALLDRAELTVTEITQVLRQSQPRISRHLKLMVDAGLLRRFPEGNWVFYRRAEDGEGAALSAAIAALAGDSHAELQEDARRLADVREARARAATRYFAENAQRWNDVRAHHVPEQAVEAAITRMLGARKIGTLVDLGTGTARMLEVLAPYAERGIGIDLSHDMLSVARANLERAGLANMQVRHGNILRLDPAALGFAPRADVVVIHHVLHFLEHPGEAVAQGARLLSEQGRMLIADFAPHSYEKLREQHEHRRLGFTDEEVAAWAAQSGLCITHRESLAPARSGADQLTVQLWLLERAPERQVSRKTKAA